MIVFLVKLSGGDRGLSSSNLSSRSIIFLHLVSREGVEILEQAHRFSAPLVFLSEAARAAAEFL